MVIQTKEILDIVNTLALTTRMRVKGEVYFDISDDLTGGMSLSAMEVLKRQVVALNRNPSSETGDGKEGVSETTADYSQHGPEQRPRAGP
ncbi:uncharacterized protein BO97DRAFT_405179 [Aspergillus homomorphus CBS 101889]|uniref:Uncharacterized protein n=1 Tax=Aspergillus homomorphus (strain CBS 101889) TaxID=1450537 RepID=A0A395HYR1_ASPHC|nr:hypothetical protein BO97DRAFT_405179 [Aspergillus homomorphus CBS 101889]RAL12940.1 hypothetical protein BO97DRAFT_405179 [Aspergillus homomorphus CBS 101889]